MAIDFRDGKTYPRRGRTPIGDALWLARMFDKARAAAARTMFDYIYPCPMDKGVMERWGITPGDFDAALKENDNDEAIYDWLLSRTTKEKIATANDWLLKDKVESMDRQDAEEGIV